MTMKKITVTIILFTCLALTSYSQTQDTTKHDKQKPKATYQIGSAKVSVWENKRQGKNGEFIAKSFKVEKIYKKGDEWKTTNSFNEKELLELKAAIDKAIAEESVKTKATDEPK